VALDIDAVRAALGIERFEFYGGSYAAVDVQAYAARFGEQLSAVVLDSPLKIVGLDDLARSVPPAIVRAVTLVCRRSLSCSADHRQAGREIGWLAKRLRRRPIVGSAIDSTGKRHHLRVTEAFLAWRIVQNTGGPFIVDSEIAAAATALRSGDKIPLLRLAADSAGPLIGAFSGDRSSAPSAFSGGDNTARFCTDATFPWNKHAAIPVRRQQFAAARAALPKTTFSPFSVSAWPAAPAVGLVGPDPWIVWPAPAPSVPPAVPAGTQFPSIPALVLSGDLDSVQVPSADSRDVAKLFPDSRFVELADSGHHTVFNARGECSAAPIQRFLKTHSVGSTACARSTAFVFPAVGRFPRLAAFARPAAVTSRGGDHSTRADRHVAAAAALALKDVYGHGFMTGSNGVGLRGGTYQIKFTNSAAELRLHGVRLTKDVATTGRSSYPFKTSVITASLKVRGPRGEAGRITVKGAWLTAGARQLEITGELGGRRLALEIPAT
jgi:pimeloyl-ACP methyl ester carboxylesterase